MTSKQIKQWNKLMDNLNKAERNGDVKARMQVIERIRAFIKYNNLKPPDIPRDWERQRKRAPVAFAIGAF